MHNRNTFIISQNIDTPRSMCMEINEYDKQMMDTDVTTHSTYTFHIIRYVLE